MSSAIDLYCQRSQVFRRAAATDSMLLGLRPEALDSAKELLATAVEMAAFDRRQYEYRCESIGRTHARIQSIRGFRDAMNQ
jgi:hypothetical protein